MVFQKQIHYSPVIDLKAPFRFCPLDFVHPQIAEIAKKCSLKLPNNYPSVLNTPESFSVGAYEGEELVGYALIRVCTLNALTGLTGLPKMKIPAKLRENLTFIVVEQVTTAPGYRKRGIATSMLARSFKILSAIKPELNGEPYGWNALVALTPGNIAADPRISIYSGSKILFDPVASILSRFGVTEHKVLEDGRVLRWGTRSS